MEFGTLSFGEQRSANSVDELIDVPRILRGGQFA
jgi:hypothetical protein